MTQETEMREKAVRKCQKVKSCLQSSDTAGRPKFGEGKCRGRPLGHITDERSKLAKDRCGPAGSHTVNLKEVSGCSIYRVC